MSAEQSENPVLYSFRRCPYAMRARMALYYAGVTVELREVLLRDKPAALIDASPKATVPVLVLPGGTAIDESYEIMLWALRQNDKDAWMDVDQEDLNALIQRNDGPFKQALDRFKYPDRYADEDCSGARQVCETVFHDLNDLLTRHSHLMRDGISIADIAIMPFIRQCAFSDKDWFEALPVPKLKDWLESLIFSDLFDAVMVKREPWQPSHTPILFGHS